MFGRVSWLFKAQKIDRLTLGDVSHDYSLVVEFWGSADTGKTAGAVALVLDLLKLGYKPDDVHANIWLDVEGSHYHTNAEFRKYLREVLSKGLRHKILLADEIDSMYPSRGFKDKLQTEEVLKLNQMTKTECWFITTHHKGSSIDKIIRDCMNISLEAHYLPGADKLVFEVLNAVDCDDEVLYREVYPASEVFKRYKPMATYSIGGFLSFLVRLVRRIAKRQGGGGKALPATGEGWVSGERSRSPRSFGGRW